MLYATALSLTIHCITPLVAPSKQLQYTIPSDGAESPDDRVTVSPKLLEVLFAKLSFSGEVRSTI